MRVSDDGVDRENADRAPIDKKTGLRREGAIGLDSQDIHFKGDLAVSDTESYQSNGDIIQQIHTYDPGTGKFRGTREVYWEKASDGKYVIRGNRRTY